MLTATSPLATNDQALLSLFDSDDFIINADTWTESLAKQLAHNANIGNLTQSHWDIIYFIRDKYLRLGAIPPMRRVCKEFGHDKDAVRNLFGGCLPLWQISGLPYPGDEAKSHMN